ncbi:7-cyano-7-deazaguanine synthase [Flavobacterium flavipallidum]|uniref:7-cyano-7-deazaguanine synthase n=1 Tax=Flavobacterium flavipallidum TaxID=3139140 RepID=A0ABU9HP90_9FLAO
MQKPILLLWTSGWDSTFRLLQIIFIEKKTVQPIYIIDKNRKSLSNELNAIENIKNKIKTEFPTAYQLIQPIWLIEKEEINISKEITTSTDYINANVRMGSQYSWLAQFCNNSNLENVEIGIDKNTDSLSFTHFLTVNYILTNYKDSNNKELYTKLDTLFKYFSFPIYSLSKSEMHILAKKYNWEAIMQMTWFCHKPKNNTPCGKCVPCIAVIKKGLGYRIPTLNRIKGYMKIYSKMGKLIKSPIS